MESLIKLGYLGLFLAAFLAATLIPVSSEIVLTGLIALKANLWVCIVVATLGNFLGGMTTYGLGYFGKWEWIEKYFKKSKEDILKFQVKVQKIGLLAAAFTWLPIVGDLAALALGFLKFKPVPVAVMMLLGRFIRFVVSGYIAAYILERVGG